MLKKILLIKFLFLGYALSLTGQTIFSIDQLKSDLAFYKSKLEQFHPGLYLYSSKAGIDSYFDSLSALITKPLDDLEFYRIITLTSAKIRDGHTLLLPGSETTAYHNKNSPFLPLQIGVYKNGLFVKMNCSATAPIPDGSRIVSINGQTSEEIIQQLTERQVRDGNNLSYAYWILDNYFRDYYSYHFGHPDNFTIEYESENGVKKTSIPGLAKDSLFYYRSQRYPDFRFDKKPGEGITLKLDTSNHYALLKIRDFHNDVLRKTYHQPFNETITGYFSEIVNSKVDNLVLDLRDNQGGDIENGVYLLSWLLNKPFKVVTSYNCVESQQLVSCKGPSSGSHNPKENPFSGKLYVLVNGGSFSNSGIVASCLRVNQRAVFIGTETGGNPNVLTGFPKGFELPNTKIKVEIPSKQFVMTSVSGNDGRGLVPDYIVEEDVPSYINKMDMVLVFALKMIGGQ
ncbi:MAG: hypothetical protein IPP73_16385 [Chitinophagaceae bacterium]|nr:hypothetical protein [Chitinophagaceae bacterium]